MAVENFTTYTENDAGGYLTVTAPKANAAAIPDNVNVNLYKDFTADHFDALDILWEDYVASASVEPNAHSAIALSDTAGASLGTLGATDISAGGSKDAASIYRFWLNNGPPWDVRDFYAGSANTIYYRRLERAAGNNVATDKIYSDAARTTLLDTLSVAGYGTDKWRYFYGWMNYAGGAGASTLTAYNQNVDLQDVNNYTQAIVNALTLVDTNSRIGEMRQVLIGIITMVDAKTLISKFRIMFAENIVLNSIVSAGKQLLQNITDTLVLIDNISEVCLNFGIAIIETITLSTAKTIRSVFKKTMSEIISLADTITLSNIIFGIALIETLLLNDVIRIGGTWWTWVAKHIATWTGRTKNISSWTNRTKNTSDWDFRDKSDT